MKILSKFISSFQSSLHVLFVDRSEKFRIVANGNGKKTERLKVENAKIHTKVHCCSIGGRRRSQRRDLFHTSFIVFVAIVRNWNSLGKAQIKFACVYFWLSLSESEKCSRKMSVDYWCACVCHLETARWKAERCFKLMCVNRYLLPRQDENYRCGSCNKHIPNYQFFSVKMVQQSTTHCHIVTHMVFCWHVACVVNIVTENKTANSFREQSTHATTLQILTESNR